MNQEEHIAIDNAAHQAAKQVTHQIRKSRTGFLTIALGVLLGLVAYDIVIGILAFFVSMVRAQGGDYGG